MGYKIMKLLCFFDLPTDTCEEKRQYRQFRKELIKNGFTMVQFSVYMRTCPHREYSKKFEKKLKSFIPEAGNIRLLTVTEKQYEDMVFLLGGKGIQEETIGNNRLVVI